MARLLRGSSLPFLLFFITSFALAQNTVVEGFVKDEKTGEAIVFAHIFFKGTQIGITSDTTGYFRLQTSKKVDSLVVSYLGYFTQRLGIKPYERQTIEIKLRSEFTQLHEVEVIAGENPAWAILEKVVDAKSQNNPELKTNYSCEEYMKVRFDLNNFTEKIKKNIMVRPFDFIWENVDTTKDGVTFLPILFVEKEIDHYYQRSPRKNRDYIKGVNTTGLKGPKIMKFVDDLYLTPNIYDNFVVMLDKSFPSPINDNFKLHYDYTLMEDSVMMDNIKYYRITFQPKYRRELAFTGEMHVHAATYAIKQIELRFDIMANVNFVRSYWVSQTYEQVNEKDWMPVASQVLGDFTVVENSSDMTGFFGRKNSSYKNYTINSDLPSSVFKGAEIVVEQDSAQLRSDEYWKEARHLELTPEENNVFGMVERIEQDPAFLIRKKAVLTFLTGYLPVGKNFDIGNFYTFYTYNIIEHSRFKFGFRSSKDLSFPVKVNAYVAYGTFDEKWKYSGAAEWNIGKHKNPKRLGVSYLYDIEQLGRSYNQIEIDNLVTSFVQYGDVTSRMYKMDFKVYAENMWAPGLLTRLTYFNTATSPTNNESFEINDNGNVIFQDAFKANGVAITLKYSWQNRDVSGEFYSRDERKVVFRKYPDIGIEWRWANKDLYQGDLNFQKISAQIKQKVRMGKLGYFQYNLEAGKTFGTVPYPYLNIPFGNQLVLHDDVAFNLMNFLEYASDEYVTLHVQHHFDGLILDRIPLINKLKWRSLIFARAYWGGISDANNQSIYLFPENLNPLNKGYYEAGFGIENIFKISRIDFTWRLTDSDAPGVYAFIVKPSFRLAF
ncbi:MAG TPA: DUF5686 family protein [Chryseolinea sp.]|nr:DUF5686 family protein [Chryseolinea sp.]